jgi:prepilin-type N-terminal cleavage/methylation domain-containing protein
MTPCRRQTNAAAFSLIEMLVVVAVLLLLALVVLPRLTGGGKEPISGQKAAAPRERAKQAQGVSYTQQLNMALQMYRDDNDGKNPPALADLKRYGATDEMLRDPVSGQPLSYDPRTGAIGGGNASPGTLPRVPGY